MDIEDAETPEDVVAELAFRAQSLQGASQKVRELFSNVLQTIGQNIEEVGVHEFRVKFRAGLDSSNWHRRGDEVFTTLSQSQKLVVVAIDELPIFVNRLLHGEEFTITTERRNATDVFMSWLRRNGQLHQNRVCIIVSGSIGLEPVPGRSGLSAHANFLAPFRLEPWSHETASDCLGALARGYQLEIPVLVRQAMCEQLRSCIPHHVQHFFDQLHEHLRREGRTEAAKEDAQDVYKRYMLGVRGQVHLEHYESRLKMVLGDESYGTALELLTEGAINDGLLTQETIEQYRLAIASRYNVDHRPLSEILYILEHDGYLERDQGDYRFASRLLEDWWRTRHREYFVPISER